MNSNRNEDLNRRIDAPIADDPQLAAAAPNPVILAAIDHDGVPFAEILKTVMYGYADRPALGQRAVAFVADDAGRRHARPLPWFDTITYRQPWRRIGSVAGAWHHDSEIPLRAGDFVATLGFASIDYLTLDLACAYLGAVSVPLQAGASAAQLSAIVAETEPKALASDIENLSAAVRLAREADSVRWLIVFDYQDADDDHRAALDAAHRDLADAPIRVATLGEMLVLGRQLPAPPLHTTAREDDLALIIYTSGSTGTPKGAMYTDRLVAELWRHGCGNPLPTIELCYMPMSHVAGRMSLAATLVGGGTLYFAARSDMSTIFDDLALVRPSKVFFVPRVSELIYQRFCGDLARRATDGEPSEITQQVKAELREQVLGGRILLAVTGSAPISAELREFMESVLDVPLYDGYGTTETGGENILDTVVRRPPVLDYRLVDVPELGYFRTDQPYPRGELLIKVDTQIPGYYKRPELNAEIFDPDGFYRTGDVMAEIAPDRLVYVDRSKNVVKLSQGEFVAVSKLEALFIGSSLVRQIYDYGSVERSYLLAVVVPTPDAQAEHPAAAELKAAISASLQRVARDAQLNSYEIPRDLIVETEPFSVDNGLLSGIGKLLRPKLKERYSDRLERRYDELDHRQAAELTTLRHEGRTLPVTEAVTRAVQAVLGISATALQSDAYFTEPGGDSLSALSLSNLLGEIFDIEVPVNIIVSAATDLRGIANYIEAQRDSEEHRPTVTSVHGHGVTICAADLTLDKFVDPATLAVAATVPDADTPARTVLLTGANGYLGRFLCLEWLERLHDSGGRLICLVRGRDATAARKRLDAVFDSGDPELLRRYRSLAEDTLEVLAGDVGPADLGLTQQDWHRLAGVVDLIVHPAALVNHVLPYEQLFGPNVVGTAEIIRLALTERKKPVTFLSSVAVANQINPRFFTEEGDIRDMSPTRVLDDSYANGYGNSKWAGEVLLREANEHYGLPVAVFRSDMILAHSYYAGQLNVTDMFTRLLLSLLITGVAPKSFYELDSDGDRQWAHYEGLPVDFTATAITTLGAISSGHHTFDVLNPHDDGISLDTFVDWLIDAGHPIRRLDAHDEWLSRLSTALHALPERQRQASVLPLLDAYRRPAAPNAEMALPAKAFQTAVQAAGIGPDRDIPHLSRALIEKYVADLHQRNLL
ncbi:carboxylic acid reductase [Nocardia sp. CA-128927]|uniref:carboxylic acid reductase n=1 Tax=Nocardia sp. CA-128927 TaxID=3239975 RepID=UPI003D98913D